MAFACEEKPETAVPADDGNWEPNVEPNAEVEGSTNEYTRVPDPPVAFAWIGKPETAVPTRDGDWPDTGVSESGPDVGVPIPPKVALEVPLRPNEDV